MGILVYPNLAAMPPIDNLQLGSEVSLCLGSLMLIWVVHIWEAFVQKEIRFQRPLAAKIRPPWAYVIGIIFLVFALLTLFGAIKGFALVIHTCHDAECVGQAYILGALNPPSLLFNLLTVSYFGLWLRRLSVSSPRSTSRKTKQRHN